MVRRFTALVALVAGTAVLCGGAASARADTVPFNDPAAQGSIGLCDRSGKPVTSGTNSTTPFVWKAVGSQRAPDGYDVPGAKATLYAYQPQADVSPDRWTGFKLSAASTYTNMQHPSAQATNLDKSLDRLMAFVPPGQDGLLQLRLGYTAPQKPGVTDVYAATVIKVDGSSWRVVQGASVSCSDGTARSSEVDAGVVDEQGNAIGAAAATAVTAVPSGDGSSPETPTGAATTPSTSDAATEVTSAAAGRETARAAATSSSSGGPGPWVAIAVAVAVVIVGGAVWWWRRRNPQAG